jgi:hypothetical protein
MYFLVITYNETGHTSVRSYQTRFDRALEMILLSALPVRLRVVDPV